VSSVPKLFLRLTVFSSNFASNFVCYFKFHTLEWFAAAENLLNESEPVWKEDLYTDYGKWMDGWESRRRRTEGYDWCIIKLGIPGVIHRIEIDTAFFTGNFSPMASIFATYLEEDTVLISSLI
jgi:allantoicase